MAASRPYEALRHHDFRRMAIAMLVSLVGGLGALTLAPPAAAQNGCGQ